MYLSVWGNTYFDNNSLIILQGVGLLASQKVGTIIIVWYVIVNV